MAFALMACVLAGSSAAPAEAYYRIEPGPKKISDEEKAISPDPARGIENALILVEETDLDESDPHYPKTTYHLRAKILSNAGRSLANIEVPWDPSEGYILRWWARTLLPDGSAQELRLDELQKMTLAKGGGFAARVRKGALKGVAPGCVIDYGYSHRSPGWMPLQFVPLAGPWPIRRFRYRWLPAHNRPVEHRLRGTEGLAVEVTQESGVLTIAGADLPPAVSRRESAEGRGVLPAAILSYVWKPDGAEEITNSLARRLALTARRFAEGHDAEKAVNGAVDSIGIPADADLNGRLHAAYDWLAANIAVASEDAAEAPVIGGSGSDWLAGRPGGGARRVLAERAGGPRELDSLFMVLARALGAEAHLVIARARNAIPPGWGGGLPGPVFDDTLVAVRSPGDPDGEAVFADPGSGLPYGEIPWWLAPSQALLATEQGGREISLPSSDPKRNVAETRATISYPETDGGAAAALWSRRAGGQWGLAEVRALKKMAEVERDRAVDQLCGAGPDFDVSRSEGPDLDSVPVAYRLTCEGRRTGPGPRRDADELNLTFQGAWIERLPEPGGSAVDTPVFFRFPGVELLTIEMIPPEGFVPLGAPEPVLLETPFARYSLTIEATPIGYRVKRDFALLTSRVAPEACEDLRRFLDDVRRADRTYLTFRREEVPPS